MQRAVFWVVILGRCLSVLTVEKERETSDKLFAETGVGKIFLLNLDSRKDRLEHSEKLLRALNLPFERISSYDGRGIYHDQIENFSFDPEIRYRVSNLKRDVDLGIETAGRICCWLTHLHSYLRAIRWYRMTGLSRPVLILEDDIDLEADFKNLLRDRMQRLPSDWEMFFMGVYYEKKCKQLSKIFANCLEFYGAQSYVIRNEKVARKLVGISNQPEYSKHADWQWLEPMQKGLMKGYLAYPDRLSTVLNLGSDIQAQQASRSFNSLRESLYWRLKNEAK